MSDPTPSSEAATAGSGDGRSTLWRFAPLVLFAGLGAVFAWALFNNSGGVLPSTYLARPAPAFSMPLLDRSATPDPSGLTTGVFDNRDLQAGGVTVVNLWASWCAPCRIEHPQLMALAERSDVTLFGIAYHDDPQASRLFLEELGDPFAKVGVDAQGQTALKWGVEGVPETFVINGDGAVVFKHTGPISPEELQSVIIPAIEGATGR